MTCTTLDLKAYFLGEAGNKEKSDCEAHLAHCESCRLELDQLRLLHSALLSIPEQEIPRRIAFVSDRVFEPKWWQTIWRSGPAMGFASAVLLACAILFHGATRPAPAPVASVAAVPVPQLTEQQIEAKIQTAVTKAVAEARAADQQKTTQMLAAASQKFEGLRQDLVAAQQSNRLYQQQMGRMMVAANTVGAQ